MSQPMVNTESVARRAAVHPEKVRAAVRAGELRAYRFGHILRYEEADVQRWLASQVVTASGKKD